METKPFMQKVGDNWNCHLDEISRKSPIPEVAYHGYFFKLKEKRDREERIRIAGLYKIALALVK
jgi:hypothetical protein